MFSGLRENSIFYVLDKTNGATLKTGQVIQVSNPQPKFPQYQPGQYNIQAVETTVDIKVRMPDGDMEFRQLPSNAQIANSGNVVVSESKDAMMAEVEAMQRIPREDRGRLRKDKGGTKPTDSKRQNPTAENHKARRGNKRCQRSTHKHRDNAAEGTDKEVKLNNKYRAKCI